MHLRGSVYWSWADPEIHFRNKDERLSDGSMLNIQVRTSKTGVIQLFLGIYTQQGTMLLEEAYDSRPGESMTQAIAWAMERAKERASRSSQSSPSSKPERLPRNGSRQAN